MRKFTEMKKFFAVTLAAAVLATSVPVDAAQVKFWNGDKEVDTLSGNAVSGNTVSFNAPSAPKAGQCQVFVGWNVDGKKMVKAGESFIVSDNAVVSANAVFSEAHDYKEVVVKKATCTEAGEKAEKCAVCGEVKKGSVAEIKAKGHGELEKTTTEATCEKDGSVVSTCKDCKAVVKQETIKATGHKWNEGEVTKEATAKEEGVKTFTCETCKATKTEAVDKLEATIKLNVKSIKLKVKQSTKAVQVSGLAEGDAVKSWESSNTKIVKVNKNGKITATNKTGKAVITVTTECGAKAELKVTVQKKAVALKKLAVNASKVTLTEKEKFTVVATKSPITAAQKVTYKTSNKKVATVNAKGVITAKKAGTATITVKAGSMTKKIKVTVKPALKKITVKKAKVTINVGKTFKIVAKKVPAKAEGKATYTSSDEEVATVNAKGVVTAKKAGKATITVKIGNKTKKVKVTVR